MSGSKGELAYDVLNGVRDLYLASMREVGTTLAGTQITVAMRAVMERIHGDGPQTVPQLARALGVTRQGVQPVIDTALRDGLVARQDNPAHARSKLIDLTERGRATFDEIHAAEIATLARVAGSIDDADLVACAGVLTRLTEAVRAPR